MDKIGDGILKLVIKQEDELQTIYSHLKAIVANPDDNWTGWRHALEILIPDSEPRLEELEEELRSKDKGYLADHLHRLRN